MKGPVIPAQAGIQIHLGFYFLYSREGGSSESKTPYGLGSRLRGNTPGFLLAQE